MADTDKLPLPERPTEPPHWVRQLTHLFVRVAIEFRFSAEKHIKQWMTAEHDEVDVKLAAW